MEASGPGGTLAGDDEVEFSERTTGAGPTRQGARHRTGDQTSAHRSRSAPQEPAHSRAAGPTAQNANGPSPGNAGRSTTNSVISSRSSAAHCRAPLFMAACLSFGFSAHAFPDTNETLSYTSTIVPFGNKSLTSRAANIGMRMQP